MPIRGGRRPSVVPITAPSFPTRPRPHVYRKIAYTFIAFTVLIVIGILWLTSVRAAIVVKVKRGTVTLDGTVDVAKTPSSGQIPGRVVTTVVEKIQEFDVKEAATTTPTTAAAPTPAPIVVAPGEVLVAKGTVRIINNYSRSQTLVKTTRLLTADNKLYRIDKTITVPAKSEMSVGVYADQPGQEYAIGPTKFSIPGLWIEIQKYIYAQSDAAFVAVPSAAPAPQPTTTLPKPTTPVTSGKVVTDQMITDAEATLKEAVTEGAKKSLLSEITDPKFTEVVYVVRELERPKTNVTVGQSTDKFMAQVKLEVTAIFYTKEDMFALLRMKLKEKIPEGREFLPLDPSQITFEAVSANATAETATLHVKAEGAYRLTSSSAALQKDMVAGKSKDEAIRLLKAVDGVDDVTITFTPRWFSKVPALKDHIDITVE